MAWRAAAILLGALVATGCEFPRDGEGTLARVRGGEMRVGVTDNPPWVRVSDDKVEGVEPALIEAWARELGARVRWVRGSEPELVEALHRRELDAVALGLEESTPYAPKLALSQPYLRAEEKRVLAVQPGESAFLFALDRFLLAHKEEAKRLAQEEPRP